MKGILFFSKNIFFNYFPFRVFNLKLKKKYQIDKINSNDKSKCKN